MVQYYSTYVYNYKKKQTLQKLLIIYSTLREENVSGRKECVIKDCELDLQNWRNCGIKDCEWTKFSRNCGIKECEVAFLGWNKELKIAKQHI